MIRHPMATTLALLIAAQQRWHAELEHAVYDVIAKLVDMADWSDERKADLYARLAEVLKPSMRIIEMEVACNKALWQNQNSFA